MKRRGIEIVEETAQAQASAPTPAPGSTMKRYVVLDLDSTLIFAKSADLTKRIEPDERNFYVKLYTADQIFKIMKRRYLDKFLDDIEKAGYGLIIWSSGDHSYVKKITSVILANRSVDYVLTKLHLVDKRKILANIAEYIPNFDPKKARLIDDNEIHAKDQDKLFVIAKEFRFDGDEPTKEEDDDELLNLIDRINESFK